MRTCINPKCDETDPERFRNGARYCKRCRSEYERDTEYPHFVIALKNQEVSRKYWKPTEDL